MSRTVLRADQPGQSLRDPDCLMTITEHGADSALHLVPVAGGLAIRRAVHFGAEALASLYAVSAGWGGFSVTPTGLLPLELRQDAP